MIGAITEWTVDYLDGRPPKAVTTPHAWRQEMAVFEEGPALYQTEAEVPTEGAWLVFHGISYAAEVSINGVERARHEGIWDAFSVPLADFAGQRVLVQVKVTKNGGPTYPVQDVASGFLPYVFHTFGGIYGDVELVAGHHDPLTTEPATGPPRIAAEGSRLYYDGKPFYMRGLLHWGWYPELGHTAAPMEQIQREIKAVKAHGFNTVKFCLWVPPHRYLEALDAEGMAAWLELPVWNPNPDPTVQRRITAELESIVRQYRRHSNIVAWTVGCEMGAAAAPSFRQRMAALVRSLTGCPLVRDDSGGAEMYGGDPREYGTFYDFHPYCDLSFYPAVIESLVPGARQQMPMLLGEFNDYDAHRDLAQLLEDHPFWASALPEFNELGVRWQYDLPNVLRDSRFAHEPRAAHHEALIRASVSKGAFIRRITADTVRSREAISGYVITGWRDTPISTSGVFDDWGKPRYDRTAVLGWNGPAMLFLLPRRQPVWRRGGNRPGYLDTKNVWCGPTLWKVGIHSQQELHAGGFWRLVSDGTSIAEGAFEPTTIDGLDPTEIGEIFVEIAAPGRYTLHVEFGPLKREWRITAIEKRRPVGTLVVADGQFEIAENAMGIDVQRQSTFDWNSPGPVVVSVTDAGALPAPFWRECAFQYHDEPFWRHTGLKDAWERLLPISADGVLDMAWLTERAGLEPEPLMIRVDTRTYAESVILARIGPGRFATTLRPFGGLGAAPPDLEHNPSGVQLLYDFFDSK